MHTREKQVGYKLLKWVCWVQSTTTGSHLGKQMMEWKYEAPSVRALRSPRLSHMSSPYILPWPHSQVLPSPRCSLLTKEGLLSFYFYFHLLGLSIYFFRQKSVDWGGESGSQGTWDRGGSAVSSPILRSFPPSHLHHIPCMKLTMRSLIISTLNSQVCCPPHHLSVVSLQGKESAVIIEWNQQKLESAADNPQPRTEKNLAMTNIVVVPNL